MDRFDDLSAAVLIGGKSRRMGRDKALLTISGVTLAERVATALRDLTAETFLVGSGGERFAGLGLPVIPDLRTGSSLGGLYTALLHAPTPYLLVAPCDLPYPDPALFRFLASLRTGCDAVVPRTGDGYEPLCAVYGKGCLGPMAELLDAGNFRIYDFYPRVRVRFVELEELAAAGISGNGLLNVNTPEEFRRLTEER